MSSRPILKEWFLQARRRRIEFLPVQGPPPAKGRACFTGLGSMSFHRCNCEPFRPSQFSCSELTQVVAASILEARGWTSPSSDVTFLGLSEPPGFCQVSSFDGQFVLDVVPVFCGPDSGCLKQVSCFFVARDSRHIKLLVPIPGDNLHATNRPIHNSYLSLFRTIHACAPD